MSAVVVLLEPGVAITRRELFELLDLDAIAAARPDDELVVYLNTKRADNPFAAVIAIPKASLSQLGAPPWLDLDTRLLHVMPADKMEQQIEREANAALSDVQLRQRYSALGIEIPIEERRRRGWLSADDA